MEYLKVAKIAAKKAGALLMSKLTSVQSADFLKNPLVKQDGDSEVLILNILKKSYPSHSFLGEEFGEQKGDPGLKWIIDPIDGTNNYVEGRDTFSISIALEIESEVSVAVVYLPKRGELFHAVKGEGAFLNDKRIMVGTKEDLREATVTYSSYPGSEEKNADVERVLTENIPNLTNFGFTSRESVDETFGRGSMAAEFCYLACGRIDGLVRLAQKPWDVAAGSLIASEAGVVMNGLRGEAADLCQGDYVASNQVLLSQINSLLDDRNR